MRIRPKTFQRLMLLAGVVGLLTVFAIAMWAYHTESKMSVARSGRDAGLGGLSWRDYARAATSLCRGSSNMGDVAMMSKPARLLHCAGESRQR